MPKSIIDRIMERKKANRELSQQKKQEVYNQVIQGEVQSEQQKELYRLQAKRAIAKAKKAIANNDFTGKRIAMQELKVAYGCFHYMGSMNDAFRTMKSQMQLQEATSSFAEVVQGLSSIRLNETPVNFAALTKKALKGFGTLDMAGLDDMVDQLIRGSISATESDQANDSFLEALISGEASLETPYPSKTLEEFDEGQGKKESEDTRATNDEMLSLLDQMVQSMKNE